MMMLSQFFCARTIAIAITIAFCFGAPRPAHAATFIVPCTVPDLVEAIRATNRTPGPDTIELTGNCSYTLMFTQDNTQNGLPIITGEISINGNGAVIERGTVSGVASFCLFQVGAGGYLQLNEITLRNGNIASNAITCPANCSGAIFNQGNLFIRNSTIVNNSASGGGAIYNLNRAEMLKDTFTDNRASTGGAILNACTFEITHLTIALNTAEREGGGIANTNGVARIRNSLIANNENGNCAGAIVNAGFNLDSAATCKFGSQNYSLSNTDPILGVLTDNGGFTNTIMLGDNSPAINRIPGDQGCLVGDYRDQRNATRPKPSASACGIDAIEVPEIETWFLIGDGIAGLATWLR